MMPHPLILASTSKYRRELLSHLGMPFTSVAPEVDEDKFKDSGLSPEELSKVLSEAKAFAVFSKHPDALVIGSDQVLNLQGTILGKPGTESKAIEQLTHMNGLTHELITAVTLFGPNNINLTFVNTTVLHMRELSLRQITEYVEQDKPLDCAGSYKLEARGIRLFSKIEMTDHSAIIGLPLIELTNHLMALGYSF